MSVLEPSKIAVPFATSGLKNPIPENSDPVTGRAGYNQGFPAINMTAKEAGGIPPYGQDFNGILFDITNALRFTQQGGIYTYDLPFATAIGGYTKGAVLCGKTTTALYQNQVDGNTTDPESSSSANWSRFGPNSYGVPMIGELVMWPSASMPQEIWPDIGAKFIPYMGQAFSKELYPKLAQIHPTGSLPADMRGEFARGWDNGRGVDNGRVIMSAQSATIVTCGDPTSSGVTVANLCNLLDDDTNRYRGSLGGDGNPSQVAGVGTALVTLSSVIKEPSMTSTSMYVRPRNIAWNMIVRAS